MANVEQITPEELRKQIEQYAAVRPGYERYASALKRVLEDACRISFPGALLQSRAKTASSFAEKVVRKFPKYRDAVNQLTDLCGGRVIVQTEEQVRAVRGFIESNFEILESDDKTELLAKDVFGYRDMHYIFRLRKDRAAALGFTPEEIADIGGKRAELQVRTWVQHAWADILHDRIYKNKLARTRAVERMAALLAALMEEGDRNFNSLADELDGLIANYTAFATKDEVEKEMSVQQLILDSEANLAKKQALALELARLASAAGDHQRAISLLQPHTEITGANRARLLLELGSNFCRLHQNTPAREEYLRGIQLMEEALKLCAVPAEVYVPDLRRGESLHARAFSQLGWAVLRIHSRESDALDYTRLAHEKEPTNPYYFAEMLGLEMRFNQGAALPESLATAIRTAVRTCKDHAARRIELPYAFFTAGRLSLLLGQGDEALSHYARGIRYVLEGAHYMRTGILEEAEAWIRDTHPGKKPLPACQRVLDLIALAPAPGAAKPNGAKPVLIVAGGAGGLKAELADKIRPVLRSACELFDGTIYSGGTNSGVPGSMGNTAADLAAENKKRFELRGYVPTRLPHDVAIHPAYGKPVTVGSDFSPDQMLQYWRDILTTGIHPQQVLLIGFGGGALSAVEYRIALAFGASVGLVTGTGGAVDDLLRDILWSGVPNLYPLPFDSATVRAFVVRAGDDVPSGQLEEMGKTIHASYVAGNTRRVPANLRPWDKLDPTFKKANTEQALYSVAILKAVGFDAVPATEPVIFTGFTEDEVKLMAELEHGRWNVERLRDGWRYGMTRSDADKIHDCLVPWNDLPDDIRVYDLNAVKDFPALLAKAGLEVRRREVRGEVNN